MVNEQIRRGHRMAQALDEEDRSDRWPHRERRRQPGYDEEDWRRERRGGHHFLEMPMRHVERLTREILHQIGSARPSPWRLAELVLRLQLEAFSELTRLGFSALGGFAPRGEDYFEEDTAWVERDIDESYEEIQEEIWEEERESEAWDWPPAPSSPTTVRSTVPIPVYVSSHERTEIDLDLPAGSQSLELEVEPPPDSGAGRPAFEAELVAFADGPVILRIEVPRDLPAGRYRRRVLIRATGEPVGNLTVQVGAPPEEEAP
jgi:hypothetical protein